MRFFVVFFLWFVVFNSAATSYYVKTNGNNVLSGLDLANAWLTIQKAEDTMVAGDTVYVQPGLYDERIAITARGTNGTYINYVGQGPGVVCRGFDLTAVTDIRIIGFEITHDDAAFNRGIALNTTTTNIHIIDNYIHDVQGAAIQSRIGSKTAKIFIRGNIFDYVGRIPGVSTTATTVISTEPVNTAQWLVEANKVTRCGDFITTYGQNHINRNNVFSNFSNALLNVTDSYHQDMFFAGSGGIQAGVTNHIYEANYVGESLELNSHGGLWQDSIAAGDTNIIFRGNFLYNLGSGGIGARSTDGLRAYNNTFFKINQLGSGEVGIWWSYTTDYSMGGLGVNLLIYGNGVSSTPFSVPAGNVAVITNNIGHYAGTHASFISTNNPLFISTNAPYDFRLQSGSPARATGTNILYVTSADGSGTSFDVNNGQLLTDGFDIAEGDLITVNGATRRITDIVENTITVNTAVSWTLNMPVYWGTDTTPDVGAFPFESVALSAATYQQFGNYYIVTPVGNARCVWFYENGIPLSCDYDAPYEYTSSGGTVVAKAYALYAQTEPVVTALPLTKAISSGTLRSNTTFRP